MPIDLPTDALSNAQKNAVKESYELLLRKYGGEYPLDTFKILLKEIKTISNYEETIIVEFSIYLEAVTKYLDLDVNRRFFLGGEKKLIAALRYFSVAQDVIPDWEIGGFIDDIYCLNLALKDQSKNNLHKIETSVEAIKIRRGFN
jgi:uncharacterized membrane protein YkvA (DUF1232 family)